MGARGRVPAAKAERPLVAKLNRRNPQLYLADVLARNRVRCRLSAGGDSLERTRLWRPIPCYTGKYRELRQIRGSATDQMVQIGRKTRGLQRSSLCRLTGNFLRPNRDLNRAIRVIFGLIRELGAGAPAPDLAGASAKKRTAHVFPKGPDEFTRAAQLALGS